MGKQKKRNKPTDLHGVVCGFHIVEFFNAKHRDPHDPDAAEQENTGEMDGMFRFEKKMK